MALHLTVAQPYVDIVANKRRAGERTVVMVVQAVFFLIYFGMVEVFALLIGHLQVIMLKLGALTDDHLGHKVVQIGGSARIGYKRLDDLRLGKQAHNVEIADLHKRGRRSRRYMYHMNRLVQLMIFGYFNEQTGRKQSGVQRHQWVVGLVGVFREVLSKT